MVEDARRGPEQIELGDLRVKLDQMTERIVSRFKDRLRFPMNEVVYETDGVHIAGRSGISFLQFALEGLENYHASLGRFDYPDQYPVLGVKLPTSSVERVVDQAPLPKLSINISDSLLPFYRDLLSKYCEHKNDPDSYGETVYIDADLLQIINERINIGRYVAEVKARKDPTIFGNTSDESTLLSKLKDKNREEALIVKVRNTAEAYELNPELAEDAFRWMIDETIFVEISYIQQVNETRR